jgi:hypothetical protein
MLGRWARLGGVGVDKKTVLSLASNSQVAGRRYGSSLVRGRSGLGSAFAATVVFRSICLLGALTQKRGNIPRTLGHSHNFDELVLDAIENQVRAYRPEKDRVFSEVFSLVPHRRGSCKRSEGVKEFANPSVGGVDVVVGDVFPNLFHANAPTPAATAAVAPP